MVPEEGLEPTTFALQKRCTTNCATLALLSDARIRLGSPLPALRNQHAGFRSDQDQSLIPKNTSSLAKALDGLSVASSTGFRAPVFEPDILVDPVEIESTTMCLQSTLATLASSPNFGAGGKIRTSDSRIFNPQLYLTELHQLVLAPAERFELPTLGFGIRCSNRTELYWPISPLSWSSLADSNRRSPDYQSGALPLS